MKRRFPSCKARNHRLPDGNKQIEGQDQYSGYESLHDSEAALVNYYDHVFSKIKKSIPDDVGNILDFGAGQGLLTSAIKEVTSIQPDCIEIDPRHSEILKSLGFRTYYKLDETPVIYDFIYSKDVLEHIKDDQTAILEMGQKLARGGVIAIYVPAIPFIYSGLDMKVGHFRRYKKRELVQKVENAGFRVNKVEYVDIIGVLVGIALRSIGETATEKSMNYRMFRVYDRVFFPVSKCLDSIFFKHVLGKNLLIVAVKM